MPRARGGIQHTLVASVQHSLITLANIPLALHLVPGATSRVSRRLTARGVGPITTHLNGDPTAYEQS